MVGEVCKRLERLRPVQMKRDLSFYQAGSAALNLLGVLDRAGSILGQSEVSLPWKGLGRR